HDNFRTLVYSEIRIRKPYAAQVESIFETIITPDPVSECIIEKSQCVHGFIGRIGKRGYGSRGRNRAIVVCGGMRGITVLFVAGCEPPAGIAVAAEMLGICYAVIIVDLCMVMVLDKIIGISV